MTIIGRFLGYEEGKNLIHIYYVTKSIQVNSEKRQKKSFFCLSKL